ncbi:hypothetical protein [Actinoplanes sp. DH11]|uniref:hypothetical protein n=1 Tax=Actinoplanes sp. DH11 TaxID=2857011 RepID=UPI001E491005|nr:hypothetical protein [Actinoplanes sp. DH11]
MRSTRKGKGRAAVLALTTLGVTVLSVTRIKDTVSDGSCVRIRYLDAGTWSTQATSCDSAGYSYTFNDRNGSPASYFVGQLTASGAQTGQYLNVGY